MSARCATARRLARFASRAGVVALALLLQACVSHPPPLPGAVYSGRIAVRSDADANQPAHSVSGQFELSGGPSSGQLILTSPIGTTVARARWSHPSGTAGEPTDIELEANGGTAHYDSLDAMMHQAIGDQLPLAAMFDWLAGRPWPNAPVTRDAGGTAFDQLGWHVDESQFASARLIDAVRAAAPAAPSADDAGRPPSPTLHVRVKLDAPADDAATPSTASPASVLHESAPPAPVAPAMRAASAAGTAP